MRRVLAICACAATSAQADHRFEGRDIAVGEALYAEHCAACHGANLEGQPDWTSPGPDGLLPAPPHDETGHTWHHDTDLLMDYTLHGGQAALDARGVKGFTSGMPAFEDLLSEDAVLDILAFIRSTWPQEVQEVQSHRSHVTD
ncbi:MAG: cytochrome c [Pseudomonadota bacterium]|nr:cytochrome c [Pseudomonadota bacterium]